MSHLGDTSAFPVYSGDEEEGEELDNPIDEKGCSREVIRPVQGPLTSEEAGALREQRAIEGERLAVEYWLSGLHPRKRREIRARSAEMQYETMVTALELEEKARMKKTAELEALLGLILEDEKLNF